MGHKVLLADDSITVQKIVKLSLSEEGMEVIAFGNGEQAVEQIENLQPDLVMADVFMPGKDGYEVCEFVKAHPQLKNTPVILLVHAFEPFDPERAKKAGADHQLTKPFQSIRTLVQTVQDLLAKGVVAPAETSATAPGQVSAPAPLPTPVVSEMPQMAMPAMSQMASPSAEEFAVVSSLTPPASENFFAAQPVPVLAETPMPSVTVPSSAPASLGAVPMSEAELPGPPPISGGLVGAADIMPPMDLPVIPSGTLESLSQMSVSEPMPEMPAPMPVMATPEPLPVALPVTTPLSVMPPQPMTAPIPMAAPMMMSSLDMSDDNLLEIPDMVPTPMETVPSVQPASIPMSSASLDMGVLSTLGTPEPPPMPVVAQPAFPQNADLGIGKIDLNAAMDVAPVNFEQDVQIGSVMPQANTENMQLSEAMIEEIVKRVVERLSSKAVQEIAWEVVPEMAELMIRKQMSQHQQLAH